MPAAWPATLPQLPLPGWSEDAEPNTVESEVGSGPPKVRRRSTRERRFQECYMEITGAQRTVFNEFWDIINHGVLSFEWSDMATGDIAEFRFTEKPKWKNLTPGIDPDTRWYGATVKLEVI